MSGPAPDWSGVRDKIIGLGEQSSRKSYYPELQKRLEDLRASEENLRTIFNSTHEAILIHDFAGRLVAVNEPMLALYRVSRQEALAFCLADYTAPGKQLEQLVTLLNDMRRTRQDQLFEWVARRPLDGTTFDVEVSLRVGNREAVIADLDRGRCELAIMGRPPREPSVDAVPLGPHPHGVVLPPDHPLAGADGHDPDALLRETFLSREPGSGTRVLMQRFLDRLEAGQPARIIEMDSNETIKQAVLAGLGIAFLSLHTVDDELRTGRLALLSGPHLPVMRHWYLVSPMALPPGPVAARIATEIGALSGSFLPRPLTA